MASDGEWMANLLHVAVDTEGAWAPAAGEDGWVDLLGDGGLAGWRRVPAMTAKPIGTRDPWTYNAATGILRCEGKGIHEMLLHGTAWADGILSVEWRYVDPTAKMNSGLYVRTQGAESWYQAQLAPASAGVLFGSAPGPDGKPVRMNSATRRPELVRPAGEWNRTVITCRGATASLMLNGVTTVESAPLAATAGFPGLEAEGAQIEFRRILFKPLP